MLVLGYSDLRDTLGRGANSPFVAVLGLLEWRGMREMRDVVVADEDCRVLGPGPEARAYEEG